MNGKANKVPNQQHVSLCGNFFFILKIFILYTTPQCQLLCIRAAVRNVFYIPINLHLGRSFSVCVRAYVCLYMFAWVEVGFGDACAYKLSEDRVLLSEA